MRLKKGLAVLRQSDVDVAPLGSEIEAALGSGCRIA